MSAAALLRKLHQLGIELRPKGDKIAFRPKEAMTPELFDHLQSHKAELLAMLRSDPHLGLPLALPVPLSLFALVARTSGACYLCGSVVFWRLKQGVELVCAVCHPPQELPGGVEWKRGKDA